MDLNSITTPSQYHCCVFRNNAILNGVENPPMNAFVFQIIVRNMISFYYLSHHTNQWVLHSNLNEQPHFSKNLILSASNYNNVFFDVSTSFNEIALVLTEASIPTSEHPCIMAKLNSTVMAVVRRFGNLEDKTIPLVVDIAKSHFQIIRDPFQPNLGEYLNNQWASTNSGGFEEFGDNEEEENEVNNEMTRLSMQNEEEVEEDDYNSSPATESSIAALEKVKSGENGECAICLGEMEVNEMVTRMPCGHIFHGGCIVQWLGKRHVCPLCRFEMPIAAAAMDDRSTA
ncbi:unnamed protein product [Cuscuta epithymum]|uniref:RING-type E3 ubiquitin transferase n=1 Tax=Cuscuta epithymum TaxID=186058 RepID=A0AAV0CAV1_9ASTE|nr:unnamed protein product [Cuscuta epithymum]